MSDVSRCRLRIRRAFTLLELLVVFTIIAIIVGMLLAGVKKIRESLKKAQTKSIIGYATNGLAAFKSVQGYQPSPVEHPLAGSAACTTNTRQLFAGQSLLRAVFVRAGTAGSGYSPGDLIDTDYQALRVADIAWIASSHHDRVLRDDDVYCGYRAGGDVPGLFGLKRTSVRVLGATADWITDYWNLPDWSDGSRYDNGSGLLRQGATTNEYDDTVYDPSLFMVRPALVKGTTLEQAVLQTVQNSLSSHLTELGSMQAIVSSADPDTNAWIQYTWDYTDSQLSSTLTLSRDLDPVAPVTGAYDDWHRVWLPPAEAINVWEPSRFLRAAGEWVTYRIRGSSLVDSYGNEILWAADANGNPRFLSAGPDGCFCVEPGLNTIIDTDPGVYRAGDVSTVGGDDMDATADNIGLTD